MIEFDVTGTPRPKQSARFTSRGAVYQTGAVKAWADLVAIAAREAMRGEYPLTGPVSVALHFRLKTRGKADVDNCAKGVLDPMRGIVYFDDVQVNELHVYVERGITGPGVYVKVWRL